MVFGPIKDKSEGLARGFIRYDKHFPVGRVFILYTAKLWIVMQCKI